MILVIYSDNYSDEFDVNGFKLFTSRDTFKEYIETFPERPFETYFGTNEMCMHASRADFESKFRIEPIWTDFALQLESLFPNLRKYGYGVFPAPWDDDNERG